MIILNHTLYEITGVELIERGLERTKDKNLR